MIASTATQILKDIEQTKAQQLMEQQVKEVQL
jgi:hypothetical protein